MRGIIDVDFSECNGGEFPPIDTIKRKINTPVRKGEKVLTMELEAMGTSIHIPVPQRAQGRHVRVIVEVLT